MEKINQFSMQRFMLLMKRYLMFNHKTLLIGLGAIAGTLMVIGLLQVVITRGNFNLSALLTTGQIFVFVSGLILTSLSYNEIHVSARSQFYLTLPATTAEKLFSTWLITSIVYIVVANILLSLVLLLTNAIAAVGWGSPISFFNPFTYSNLTMMGSYLVAQSIFFLGALYFRQNNFLKTLLSLFVLSMVLNIIAVTIMYLLFGRTGVHGGDFEMMNPGLFGFLRGYGTLMVRTFSAAVVLFCLTVSYFKLKEREV
jgi:hypothetical protein